VTNAKPLFALLKFSLLIEIMQRSIRELPDNPDGLISFTSADDFLIGSGFQDGGFIELSAALAAAQAAPSLVDTQWITEATPEGTSNESTTVSSPLTPCIPHASTRPKLGTSSRFSTEVIRTLKNWLAAHQQHPYPRNEDMMLLQQRTGLNQAQLKTRYAGYPARLSIEGSVATMGRQPART
jgi:hypothetical protein